MDSVRRQASTGSLRVTQHAAQEMTEEAISLDDVLEAITSSEIFEDYPTHQRGACCLLLGLTHRSRPIHVVCTTSLPVLVIITVYEPKPPKWRTPRQREIG